MKKILLYIILVILLCFVVPIIFTNKNEQTVAMLENIKNEIGEKEVLIESYDYKKYNKIKLLHAGTDKIEEISLDEYLCGVVAAEMPASYEKEALKAQAIVARTYTLYKIMNSNLHGKDVDICDDYRCCQAWISKVDRLQKWPADKKNEYWNKIVNSVNETKGKIVTYEGKIINAFFHANSGGMTEIPVNVWGGTNYPYLHVVETSGEEGYKQYNSMVELDFEEIVNKFKEKYQNFELDIKNIEEEIKILEYTESGRVKTLKVGNKKLAGTEVRSILNLKSTNFEIGIEKNKIVFRVIGYGHGIGMSQTGADSMAKKGSDCEQIIKHFYVGVEIEEI